MPSFINENVSDNNSSCTYLGSLGRINFICYHTPGGVKESTVDETYNLVLLLLLTYSLNKLKGTFVPIGAMTLGIMTLDIMTSC